MKKFSVPCDFGGTKSPFTIYVGAPKDDHHPLHFQADWLSKERGGTIPQEVMDSLSRLKELSDKNGVSFEDLCVYALGAAQQEAEGEETDEDFDEEEFSEEEDFLDENEELEEDQQPDDEKDISDDSEDIPEKEEDTEDDEYSEAEWEEEDIVDKKDKSDENEEDIPDQEEIPESDESEKPHDIPPKKK